MADPRFTHLHVHTHYSLLDGANRIPDLVKQAKKLGMDSLAITDHGCMFGVVEFFNECKKEGIKPILGMEAYMAPGHRGDKSGTPGETAYHLLLMAQNLEGYHNLLKLSSIAYREGFYYKPRIDKEILREYSRGLIATSACLGGEIPSAFMRRGKMAEAKATAETYLEIFGPDRFFIEVQNHIKEQNEVNPELAELAKKTGIGLVATNDVHFLTAADHAVHDVLCCISMGKLASDESRLKYPKELYLKSPTEMVAALGNYDQAIENTTRIAAMCDLTLDFSKRYAPVYKVEPEKLDDAIVPPGLPAATLKPVPAGEPVPVMREDERYMRQLCETGLLWRYGTRDVDQAVRDRLEYEITIIAAKSFCSYFLIVWDFCNFARDNGIPVGARGSGVGSMVAFLLGLCNVDPLTYNLLFERFMDPSRNEMPDIDIDICQDGRQKVIEYVRNKYGHVAQIITFGTLAAKAACKDVGRVLGVPLAEIDKLTKMIPGVPGMTLEKAMKQVPDLGDFVKSSPMIKQVWDYAVKLEGMCRNAGCHAAGVIIADQPLDGIVPLYRDSDGNVLTQFEGPVAEKCGLLKMDFLGLRTLTSLTRSIDLEHFTRDTRPVKWIEGQPVPEFDAEGRYEIDKVDLTDPTVFKLFQRGETGGVFQFESGGMKDLLMKMVPDRIEDLIAANALYRPGPMELIPTYCNRKHGREPVPVVHPIMDGILAETYGIMVYQEQVMQIFNQLGGIELSNAYKLIKAISKKNADLISKMQPAFLKGTMEKGVSKEKAEEIFDFILKFGGYGFNKCVVGETVVFDADTGRRATVNELFHEYRVGGGRPSFRVHALGDDGKLRPRDVTDVMWNGRKAVFEVVTAQGKRITATDNHPFRTLNGWTNLGDLKVGDRVAVANRIAIPAADVVRNNPRGAVAPKGHLPAAPRRVPLRGDRYAGIATVDCDLERPGTPVPQSCVDDGSEFHAQDDPYEVAWDRVVSIEPKGVQDTYDLTVEVDHNFVADGLVVHNSHSTRYAIVAYQTAYMKTYHPVEYMSAVLTFEMGSTEKVVELIDECRRMTLADGTKGIRVLPPDVNVSDKDFTPVYTTVEEKVKRGKPKSRVEGVIRFGLAAVRGVGEKAVEGIVAQRHEKSDYANLYDFCERVDLKMCSRSTIEALVKCGGFASFGANRAQLMQVVDRAVEMGQQTQNDKRNGQIALFGAPAASTGPSAAAMMGGTLPDVDEFENAELLKFEKELLGFYITSHPLTEHQVNLERFSTASTKEAQALPEGTEVMVGGMICRLKKVVTKNGRSAGMPMAIVTLEDLDGQIDGTMFAETYAEVCQKYPDAVAAERIVFVKGKVDKKRETPSLLINEVIPITDAVAKLTTAVCLKLDGTRHNAAVIAEVPPVLGRHKGTVPIYFQVATPGGKAMLQVDRQHAIRPSPALVEDLEHLLGGGSVDLAGAGSKRRKRLEQARLFKEEADDAPAVVGVVAGGELIEPETDDAEA